MPTCEAFPEEAGRYEIDDCEEEDGEAIYVSYATKDDGDFFSMSAFNHAYEFEDPDLGWTIDCGVSFDGPGNEEYCEFGSASYMSFDDDEIIREMKSLGQSVDDDMLDEFREDAMRHAV